MLRSHLSCACDIGAHDHVSKRHSDTGRTLDVAAAKETVFFFEFKSTGI